MCIRDSYWEARFKEDLEEAQLDVREELETQTTKQQIDALTSFVFNLGGGRLRTSTLLRWHNVRQFDRAAAEFARWNKATVGGVLVEVKGLTKRRRAEYNIYVNGDYSGRP
jgi:lysozyme